MSQSIEFGRNRLDRRWARIVRYGPYVMLALACVAATLTAHIAPLGDSYGPIVGLVLAAALLHRICVDRRWGRAPDNRIGAIYLALRTVIAFVLTWLNPFFVLFAVIGYFDADEHLPRRWSWIPLVATAVTVAGSQSGGLPPDSLVQAAIFVGLVFVNVALVLGLARLAWGEVDRANERTDTIAELERTNMRLEKALQENARLQAELVTQARQSGVHDERERLALEIHDTIAQSLTGIITQLQAADDAREEKQAGRHRRRAANLARDALREARSSVQGLAPIPLEQGGLERALERVVAEFSIDQPTRTELVVTGEPQPVHAQVEAAVVRVAQEALTNVARHADAGRVAVTVSHLEGEILLDVRDDGTGFDPAAVRSRVSGGFGIPGMATRASRVAGELVVESQPGHGTAVSLRVPAVSDV
ncbi:sensor histidine kinase [Rhodococcus sp. NPDC058521]|uniref:sensor histidine kinase n=1 Tax=Rhodococcus sp. NPDC058521 TaxID=3346536 RepID=UPI0036640AD6